MSGGFRDEDEDFGDLLNNTTSGMSTSTYAYPAVEDLDTNPFADLQSSTIYASVPDYARPPPPTESYSPVSSPPRAYRFERESAPEPETPSYPRRDSSSSSRFNAPTEPASPTPASRYVYTPADAALHQTPFGSPPFSAGSEGSGFGDGGRGETMAALMGEEKPILPTFRRDTSASGTEGGHSGAPVMPITSIGKKAVGGALATLLGLEEDADAPKQQGGFLASRSAAAARSKAAAAVAKPSPPPPVVPSSNGPAPPSTATANASPSTSTPTAAPTAPPILQNLTSAFDTPLPPSRAHTPPSHVLVSTPISRAGSIAPSMVSEASTATNADYDSIVSPMDTSDGTIDAGQGWSVPPVSSRDVEGLDKKLKELSVTTTSTPSSPVPSTLAMPTSPQTPFGQSTFEAAPTSPLSTPRSEALFEEGSKNGFMAYNGGEDEGGFGGGDSNEFRNVDSYSAASVDDAQRGVSPKAASDISSPPLPSVPLSGPGSPGSVNLVAPSTPSFVISVGDPQTIGSSLNIAAQHTVYTVRTRTTSSAFRKPEFSVLRRFSHFLWLFDALTSNNPGVIVPGMPEKSAIGRFGSDFVENRRSALQAALMKIVSHPMLVGDPDLRLFLESDSFSVEIKQRKVDSPQESKGFLANLSSSISGPKFQEFDEYFETRRSTLDSFEAQLRSLLSALSNAAKVRSSLQTSLGELQTSLLVLSQCDLSTSLRGALEQAAGVQRRLRELGEQQSISEEQIGGITSVAEGYARLCGSVKLVFGARVKSYHSWQAAESVLRKMRSAHEKAKKSGRTHSELLGLSLSEISDAERRSLDAKQDFEDVSKLTRAEMARFDKEKVEDFKKAVEDYVDGMVLRQREVVLVWETYFDLLQKAADANAPPAPPSVGGTAVPL